MIRAVLFDLDGTVVDTERVYLEGFAAVAKELGIPEGALDHHSYLCGTIYEDGKRHMLDIYGEDLPYDEWFRSMRAYADRKFEVDGVPTKPGVPKVFDDLHAMGCKVALVTGSKKHRVDRYLRSLNMEDCFDCVVCGDQVAHGKPAPDCYLLAAARLGVEPRDCMVVEDAKCGILSAKNAGMCPVFVQDLYPLPREVAVHVAHNVESLLQIPALVAEKNQSEKN